MTDTALEASEIDTSSVQAAIDRAREVLRNKASVMSREEQTYLEASLAKQIAILDYNRRRHR